MSLTLPSDRIAPICDALGSSDAERSTAQQIADGIDMDPRISGRSPTTVAAACIYVAGHIEETRPSQRAIADAADVSEASIRTIYPLVADTVDADLTHGGLRINQEDGEDR